MKYEMLIIFKTKESKTMIIYRYIYETFNLIFMKIVLRSATEYFNFHVSNVSINKSLQFSLKLVTISSSSTRTRLVFQF